MKKIHGLSILLFVVVAVISTYRVYEASGNIRLPKIVLSHIEALAGEESSGGTSCTATYTCVDTLGNPNGSISCTGETCSRGIEKEGIVFPKERRYVECDGKRSYC